jgi:hypothetical protein
MGSLRAAGTMPSRMLRFRSRVSKPGDQYCRASRIHDVSFLVSPFPGGKVSIVGWAKSKNRYCCLRACSGEQRDGRPYLIGSRGYEFISADLPLSRSLQYALGEIRLCCWSRILGGHFCHDLIKRNSHDLDELWVEMWHELIPDGCLDIPRFARLGWIRRTTFQLVAICCRSRERARPKPRSTCRVQSCIDG